MIFEIIFPQDLLREPGSGKTESGFFDIILCILPSVIIVRADMLYVKPNNVVDS